MIYTDAIFPVGLFSEKMLDQGIDSFDGANLYFIGQDNWIIAYFLSSIQKQIKSILSRMDKFKFNRRLPHDKRSVPEIFAFFYSACPD